MLGIYAYEYYVELKEEEIILTTSTLYHFDYLNLERRERYFWILLSQD